MGASVEIETATLADAVNRAARVAPTKGSAYDRAAGIQIELRPGDEHPCVVRSTDIDNSFWTNIQFLNMGDEVADWRLPTALLSGFVSNLPLNAASSVKLSSESNVVTIKCGRSKATLRAIPDSLPMIGLFDPNGMLEAENFGQRINQVSWAVHNDAPPFNGIHITGEELIACDRNKVAFLPCKVPVEAPVTAPLSKLVMLLRNTVNVRVRATDRRLEIMPDDHTQLTCNLLQMTYPDVRKAVSIDTPYVYELPKKTLTEALNRMLVLARGERAPVMKVWLENDTLGFEMAVEGVGELTDEVAVVGNKMDRIEFKVTPMYFLAAMSNAGREMVKLMHSGSPKRAMRFMDDGDYDAWITPVVMPGDM